MQVTVVSHFPITSQISLAITAEPLAKYTKRPIMHFGKFAAFVLNTRRIIYYFFGYFACPHITGVTNTGSGASCQPLKYVKSGIPFNIDGAGLVVCQPSSSGNFEFPQLKACLRAVGGEQHWTIEMANVRSIDRNHRRLQAMVQVRVSETGDAELIVSVGKQQSNPWPLVLQLESNRKKPGHYLQQGGSTHRRPNGDS